VHDDARLRAARDRRIGGRNGAKRQGEKDEDAASKPGVHG
jgi:hypothetical protein